MKPKPHPPKISIEMMSVVYLILFFIAVGLGGDKNAFRFPDAGPNLARHYLVDCALALTASGILIFLTRLATRYLRIFQDLLALFRELLFPLTHQDIFMISAFSAVSEEFFFRGWLQSEVGLVGASLLFGVLHLGPTRKFLPWTLFAVVLGFVLGGLYEWRGNLLLPIVIHFSINYVNLRAIGDRSYGAGSS